MLSISFVFEMVQLSLILHLQIVEFHVTSGICAPAYLTYSFQIYISP